MIITYIDEYVDDIIYKIEVSKINNDIKYISNNNKIVKKYKWVDFVDFENNINNILKYSIDNKYNELLIVDKNITLYIDSLSFLKKYKHNNCVSKNEKFIYFTNLKGMERIYQDFLRIGDLTQSILNNNYGYIVENFNTCDDSKIIDFFNGIAYTTENDLLMPYYSSCHSFDKTDYVDSLINGVYNEACFFKENGFIFETNDIVKRIVPKNSMNAFIYSDLYFNMLKQNKIVEMTNKIEKKVFDIFDIQKIKKVSRPNEQSTYDYVKGYLFLIDLMIDVMSLGYYLKDPHINNITLYKGSFVYLDYGDFTLDKNHHSLNNFFNFFIFDNDFTDRFDNVNEIANGIEHIKNLEVNDLEKMIKLRDFISNIQFEVVNKQDNYTKIDIPINLEEYEKYKSFYGKKGETIFKYMDLLEYDSFLDIGCSTGFYSFYSSMKNKVSVGVDLSHKCIETANNTAKTLNQDCVFLAYDIMTPPSPTSIGYGMPHDRLKSDFVLVSAVTHHLFHSNYSVYKQINTFDKYCNNILMVEYVPITDQHVQPFNKTKWVDIEAYISILRNYFKEIIVEDSAPDGRKQIIAIKNIEKANYKNI